MPDPIFFPAPDPLNLADIVALTGGRLVTGPQRDIAVSGVSALDTAGPSDLVFIDNVDYAGQLEQTAAGVCLCLPRFVDKVPKTAAALEVKEPARAFAIVAARLFPAALRPIAIVDEPGVAAAAHIDPAARLEQGVRVGPFAVIGAQAEIGRGTMIGPGAVIGPNTRIGRDCSIGPGASVMHALIGNRVIIHPGARIGQDGFGYVPGRNGHLKVPQVGRVIIQDDVEIGANTSVDRGSIRDTIIGEGSKIDNLVQIGHNVAVGRHCFLAGMVGVSGSVTIGDFAALGGAVVVAPHVKIGAGVSIAGNSGVFRDVPAGERWGGYPAQPAREWMRAYAAARRASRPDETSGPADAPATKPGAQNAKTRKADA